MNEQSHEAREWVAFAVSLGITAATVWVLFPQVRFWTQTQLRRIAQPWRDHQARQTAQRQMMADVVELVATGHVPAEWEQVA